MTLMEYMWRALARLRSRGLRNTSIYSFYVIKEFLSAHIYDFKYGGKICRTDLKINDSRPECHTMVHSSYHILRQIFDQVPISADDVLVDVGCGEGRVINFWLSLGLTNKIIGLEINEEIAERTRRRYKKYQNVMIIQGNALNTLPRWGTIFFLYNPFSDETIKRFAAAVKNMNVTIIYYTDNYVDHFDKEHWVVRPLRPRGIVEYRASLITRAGSATLT